VPKLVGDFTARKTWRVVTSASGTGVRWPSPLHPWRSSSDRDRARPLFGDVIGSRGPSRRVRPEGRTQRLDSSHGVHRGPFADMAVSASTPAWTVAQTSARDCHVPDSFRSCRSSRLQRFPPQRPDPKVGPSTACGFVAPRSRPWGSPCFRLLHLAVVDDPKVVWKPFPVAKTLRSFSPSGSLTSSSPPLLLADSGAFTEWRALSPLGAVGSVLPRIRLHPDLRALFHRRVRCVQEALPLPTRPLLPWAFGSNTFRCLPRAKRWTEKLRPFPSGSNSVQGSRISREDGEGKVSASSGSERTHAGPTRRSDAAGPVR